MASSGLFSTVTRRTIAFGLLIGVLIGLPVCAVLLVTRGARRVAEVVRDERAAELDELRQELERALATAEVLRDEAESRGSAAPHAEQPAERRTQVEGWFSEALQAMALEGIARGWAKVRDDPLPQEVAAVGLARFRQQVEALPARIGRDLAEQRDRDELVEAGIEAVGVFEYLELLHKGRFGPFPDLVSDADRFGALFGCNIGGPVLSGPEFAASGGPPNGLEDGTTLSFPRGVTRVQQWTPRGAMPRCLTIEGAGMDVTLLVAQDLGDAARVEHLVLRDFTFLGSGGNLLDFRGKGSQVRLERVRVLGFDSGAGGSSCLDLNRTALLARDCRFEGGYGRSPEPGGTLFDVRTSALLARFERCRFDALRLDLERLRDRATVVFSDCSMTELRDRVDPRTVEHAGIRLVNCNVRMAEPDEDRVWRRDLDELFPGWREAR